MHRLLRYFLLLGLLICAASPGVAKEWKAGVASVNITPTNSIWLTGFSARTNASRGKLHDLHVKALALQDTKGKKSVLITSDLLGFPGTVSDRIGLEVKKRYGVSRDRLLFNSSHTHGAPSLASSNHFIYGPQASPEQWKEIESYTEDLEKKVVSVIGTALKEMQPAKLSFGQGKATFGVNRRKMTPTGLQGFTPNPKGPADPAVPVLRVDSKKGKMLAVAFGYAAHPTTITTGPHFYDFSGDYAGYAQDNLQREHPGALALFVQGCGGDIMVYPRGSRELAEKYGAELSSAVNAVLQQPLQTVTGPLRAAFQTVPVQFSPAPSRSKLEEQAKTGDLYQRWHAQDMLRKLEKGPLPQSYPYSMQAWQFGSDLTLVALAGEVVVEYSLRLKEELPGNPVWVAGYSNDLCAYIPSENVLAEGGYEGGGAMIYYMQPGPFAAGVEETIIAASHDLVSKVKGK